MLLQEQYTGGSLNTFLITGAVVCIALLIYEAAAGLYNYLQSGDTHKARTVVIGNDPPSNTEHSGLRINREIRPPMNAIIGFAGLMQQTVLNSEQKHYKEAIKSSAEKLLGIMNVWKDETACCPSGKNGKMHSVMTPEKLKSLHVLVVEDNPLNQLLAEKVLSGWKCQVVIVPNGPSALQAVERSNFDLILMDLHLPEMDGYEVTKRIRTLSNSSKTGIPIIALTADVTGNIREKCRLAGLNGYVSKPFLPEDLLEQITEVLLKPKSLSDNKHPVSGTCLLSEITKQSR